MNQEIWLELPVAIQLWFWQVLRSTTKFDNIESLLKYLTEVEIEQRVKYAHYRSFTEYTKSLNELKCGKSFVLTVVLLTIFQQLIAIMYVPGARMW